MRVLLVSTYELGHQPLNVASPAAAVMGAGHEVRALDLSVQEWDPALVDWADAVAFSVPMHTAGRLAIEGAAAVRRQKAQARVCFYGLYAHVADRTVVDGVISGEYESGLLAWLDGAPGPQTDLRRQPARLPVRTILPALDGYARLVAGGRERPAGYVEATHGCAHRCRHCPVPVVYDGRTRRVDAEVVLDDIEQQVGAGARHITFGDPDFLNRWAHGMKVVESMHHRFPDLTFDITTKVSHLIRYASLVPLLAEQGCLFVVSAFECVNDEILRFLHKGHTAADAAAATRLLRESGIEVRPSWLPFMPWTTVEDVLAILDFVDENDLVGNVDPVQYSIRLLVPPGSLMLEVPEMAPYLGPYDERALSYGWTAADPRTVGLQRTIAALVEREQSEGVDPVEIYCDIRDAALDVLGSGPAPRDRVLSRARPGVPRLTEPWFCCAEPTERQFGSLTSGSTARDGAAGRPLSG